MLPKASAYVKSYDGQTKWMYLLIEEHFLKTKKKFQSGQDADFYNKEIL